MFPNNRINYYQQPYQPVVVDELLAQKICVAINSSPCCTPIYRPVVWAPCKPPTPIEEKTTVLAKSSCSDFCCDDSNYVWKSIDAPVPVCRYRIGVNPASNPGPSGGLLIPATSNFKLPLTATPNGSLGIGDNFKNDPKNLITVNSDTITINKTGQYQLSMMWGCLIPKSITPYDPNNLIVFQLLLNSQSIFLAPPAVNAAGGVISVVGTPLDAYYDAGAFLSGSSIAQLNKGDVLAVMIYIRSDSAEVTLTSNLSITFLG